MLKAICEACGKRILAFCSASGRITLLMLQTLRRLKEADWREVVRQMALLGADSLPIVLMTILMQNKFEAVQLYGINVEAQLSEQVQVAEIQRVQAAAEKV